ncbi:sensor histidine kinase [Actinoplanes lobatus]|uniref:histidine kinase n=1 Tax=Actinoplanes lobatus TaxID=113568 RepID=A0A7W7HFV2_9ACTN|nr:GAF domain-containing sensor histidine kinase [Actinoplanes lobatus]MBB4749714.1 signal transduction histidine kinase [Actinoplanes lobatus]GGN75890.1 sensor histidine kinase [Actinoplanes lobatus]GIE38452.1 sensor histidine kinase [Actinoplanes lobatus]
MRHESPAEDEKARLATLYSYGVLGRPRSAVLDDLTRLAASMFDTPMAAVSLIDRDRQWFAGSTGLADEQTSLDLSFCKHVIPARTPLIVPNTTLDPRFAAAPNVTGTPKIRFYAGAPIIDPDGHTLGAMCVIDDRPRVLHDRQVENLVTLAGQAAVHLTSIRDRMRMADLGDELSRAVQREDDLVSAISHELRTPVASIQGYLEILGDQEELAAYRKLIDPIHRNGERLMRMVDHLLAGTRPGEAPLPPPTGRVELDAVVQAAFQSCGSLIALRAEQPRLHTGAAVPVRADLPRLADAITQVLRNALLFTPMDRAITVRTGTTPQPWVEVVDTGVGIPEHELPYVFDRFYRGRHARDHAVPGVGLGLTIARNIIESHRGRLTVTGTPSGTVARIVLPAVA